MRDRIVRVAGKSFCGRDSTGSLMDDVARELGMSKKTVYLHFESKEELLRAVLLRRVSEADAGLERLVKEKGPFRQSFGRLFVSCRRWSPT